MASPSGTSRLRLWRYSVSHRSSATDPAYTIRRALTRNLVEQRRVDAMTLAQVPGSVERVPAHEFDREAIAALDVLLAVGERDKAEIEALTAAAEGLLDVGTRSRSGDPSLDPEEWFAIRDYAQKVLKDGGGAALRESRERDRRQIARLTEAAKAADMAMRWHYEDVAPTAEVPDEATAFEVAIALVRAVLADEEDARP